MFVRSWSKFPKNSDKENSIDQNIAVFDTIGNVSNLWYEYLLAMLGKTQFILIEMREK